MQKYTLLSPKCAIKFIGQYCTAVYLLVGAYANAQVLPLPSAPPAELGVSADQLSYLDAYLQDLITKEQVPGAVVLLARRGKIFHYKAYGYHDRERKQPMSTESIFRIKSMTKPITSVAALMLVEQGKMRLDDPVSRFIPAFKSLQVGVTVYDSLAKKSVLKYSSPEREATIRDLLTHTSGLIYGWLYPGLIGEVWREKDNREFQNNQELCATLATLPLAAQPGSTWIYGRSTDVLGYVIEVVSGKSLEQFFRERIFQPLGMQDTYFELPADKSPRLAATYVVNMGKLQKINTAADMFVKGYPASAFYTGGKRTLYTGGEGLVSTAADYLRFAQMLLNGGEWNGVRILGRKTIELMTHPHVTDIKSSLVAGYDFGLGVAIHRRPAQSLSLSSIGEYSWSGAFNTSFWIDPSEQLIGIVMTQVDPFGYLGYLRQCKQLVYPALMK